MDRKAKGCAMAEGGMRDRRDDAAKLAQGALSVASGLAEEVRAMARAGSEALSARLDLVRRDEFEAMRALAMRAAEAVAALEARVAALEAARPEGPAPGAEPPAS